MDNNENSVVDKNEKKMTNIKFGKTIGIAAGVIMIIGVFFPFYTINLFGKEGDIGFFDFGGFNDGYFFLAIGALALTFSIFKRGLPLAFFSLIDIILAIMEVKSDEDGYFITGPAIGFYIILFAASLGILSGFYVFYIKLKKKEDETVSGKTKIILSAVVGILAVLIVLFEIFGNDFGKDKKENLNTYSDSDLKANDVSSAKTIKTGVETALGNELIYEELSQFGTTPILVTEEGLCVLSEETRTEILNSIGERLPSMHYKKNGVENYYFVFEKGNVSVYAGNDSNPTMFELAPDTDESYLNDSSDDYAGDYDNYETESYEAEEDDSEFLIAQDVQAAKAVKTAVETAMGNENVYEAFTTTYANVVISFNEETLDQLPEDYGDSILDNVGTEMPVIHYKEDGASGYAFIVDRHGNVTVFISSDYDITKWVIKGDKRYVDKAYSQRKQESLADLNPISAGGSSNEYIIKNSSSEYISIAGLSGFSKEECRLARNEIYARHGRKFNDSELQAYFDSCSWYNGYISPDDFDESVLNNYEKENLKTIVQYEEEMGYR